MTTFLPLDLMFLTVRVLERVGRTGVETRRCKGEISSSVCAQCQAQTQIMR